MLTPPGKPSTAVPSRSRPMRTRRAASWRPAAGLGTPESAAHADRRRRGVVERGLVRGAQLERGIGVAVGGRPASASTTACTVGGAASAAPGAVSAAARAAQSAMGRLRRTVRTRYTSRRRPFLPLGRVNVARARAASGADSKYESHRLRFDASLRRKVFPTRRNNALMGRVIGIDLGTTNSCMAVLEGGEPTVSRTPRAVARRRPSSPSRRTASGSSARRPSARRSPTRENTDLLDQALHGPQVAEVSRGDDDRPVPRSSPARTATRASRPTASSTRRRRSPR